MNAPPRGPGRRTAALLVALVLIVSGLLGFLLHRVTTHRPATLYPAAAQAPAAAPPAAAPEVPAPPPPKIPDVLPAIELPALDGSLHRLADFRGGPLVVNFWATWCEPCRREIPLLTTLRRERAKDGIEIVGIAIDQRDAVAGYVKEHSIDYPVLVGEKGGLEAASALGMEVVLPFTVFADREGTIVTLKVGELHADEARFILDRLVELDQGRLTLAAAREAIAAGIRRLNAARAGAAPGAGN